MNIIHNYLRVRLTLKVWNENSSILVPSMFIYIIVFIFMIWYNSVCSWCDLLCVITVCKLLAAYTYLCYGMDPWNQKIYLWSCHLAEKKSLDSVHSLITILRVISYYVVQTDHQVRKSTILRSYLIMVNDEQNLINLFMSVWVYAQKIRNEVDEKAIKNLNWPYVKILHSCVRYHITLFFWFTINFGKREFNWSYFKGDFPYENADSMIVRWRTSLLKTNIYFQFHS